MFEHHCRDNLAYRESALPPVVAGLKFQTAEAGVHDLSPFQYLKPPEACQICDRLGTNQ
jgi:hypothetical protein